MVFSHFAAMPRNACPDISGARFYDYIGFDAKDIFRVLIKKQVTRIIWVPALVNKLRLSVFNTDGGTRIINDPPLGVNGAGTKVVI